MDPDKQGELIWQYRAGEGSIWGGIQWGMSTDGEQLFIPVSDIRTPKPGGLHAVNLGTGQRTWFQAPPALKCAPGTPTCNAALISAPTLIPGVLFSGSNDGGLRAYATKDGSVIWEFDTNQDFTTLNRVRASGGAIQGPGPDDRRRHALPERRIRRPSRSSGQRAARLRTAVTGPGLRTRAWHQTGVRLQPDPFATIA